MMIVIIVGVIILSVVMLSVIMQRVIILIVEAPPRNPFDGDTR